MRAVKVHANPLRPRKKRTGRVAFYQAPDRHAYKSGNAVSWCQLLQVKENGSGQAWTQNS
jgi:hypothetical protein